MKTGKITLLILTAALLLTCCSCGKTPAGGSEGAEKTEAPAPSVPEDTASAKDETEETGRYGIIYQNETEEISPVVSELEGIGSVVSVEAGNKLTGKLVLVEAYDIVISSGDGTLEICLTLPNDHRSKQYPAIFWYPDAKITPERFANIAYYGYAVFAVYGRGYQDSQSTGERGCADKQDLDDIRNVLELIKDCSFTDNGRIFAVASTTFGSVAMQKYVIEEQDSGIRALALADPVSDMYAFYDFMIERYGGDGEIDEFFEHYFGGTPEEVPEAYDVRSSINYVDKINLPVLLAYFSNKNTGYGVDTYDVELSPGFADKLRKAGKDVSEIYFDFAGTDFYREESIEYLCGWFHSFN